MVWAKNRKVRSLELLLTGLVAVGMTGCEGCTDPVDPGGTPSILLTVIGGPTLATDGVSTKTITLTARDAAGEPANGDVSITVGAGELISDTGTVDGQTLTVTPSGGTVEFEYRCDQANATRQEITATNADTSATTAINCVEQQGQPVLVLEYDTQACSLLPSDGQSSCLVTARVSVIASNGDISTRPSETLSISVVSATLTPDETTPIDTPAPDSLYLALDAANAPSSQLAGVTDDQGEFTFYVRSKLDQLVSVVVSVGAPALADATGAPLATELIVRTGNFESQASVTVNATPEAIVGAAGQSTSIGIVVINPFGAPAAAAEVSVSVPDNSGASLVFDGVTAPDDENPLVVLLDDNGEATVTFTPPNVADDVLFIPVNVTYAPPNLAAVSSATTVTVLPPDALIVNAFADPDTISSTSNESTTVTVTVQQFNNGALTAVTGVDVDFAVASGDTERVGLGNRIGASSDLPLAASTQTDANGTATQTVATQNDRVRGPAGVDIVVTTAGGDVVPRSVELIVEREPILQSIVFVSADPAAIAVRGSAYPTSSLVSFRILDDLNQPMPNVAVTFNTNATADPTASVVPFGFTDSSGSVSTVLAGGTVAGPISIVARAQFAGIQLVAESLPIPVTGGLPSFANSYLICPLGAGLPPFTTNCQAVLADRFTNVAPDGLAVQFRSEGGNITPTSSTSGGGATASFGTGPPGVATTSLWNAGQSWSHGLAIPLNAVDLLDGAGFTATDCFDNDSRTHCNIIGMCQEAANAVFCPLPLDVDGVECWESLEAGVLTKIGGDLSPELLAEPDVAAFVSANSVAALIELAHYTPATETPADHPNVILYDTTHPSHLAMRTMIEKYRDSVHNCGFPTACLAGSPGGLPWMAGDECAVASGCMDFSSSTRCPHDGLISITAIARGEESFTDLNGNGVLDYIDSNGNGRHDNASVEPLLEQGATPPADPDDRVREFKAAVVDMPEPALDKNDNCYYDDYDEVGRLLTWDKIRIGDQFIDEDGDGLYGYSVEDAQGNVLERRLTNETWDRDKQLFFQTHLLTFQGVNRLEYGQPCAGASPGGVADTVCDLPQANGGQLAVCVEFGPGVYLAPSCVPASSEPLELGDSFRLAYRYVDANGNCWSPGFNAYTHVFESFFADVTGNTARDYDRASCGMFQDRNDAQPWCEDVPGLGGALTGLTVSAACNREFISFDRFETARVTTHLHADGVGGEGGFVSNSFSFTVECPFCGDGITAGLEECDDGNFVDFDGCTSCVLDTP